MPGAHFIINKIMLNISLLSVHFLQSCKKKKKITALFYFKHYREYDFHFILLINLT